MPATPRPAARPLPLALLCSTLLGSMLLGGCASVTTAGSPSPAAGPGAASAGSASRARHEPRMPVDRPDEGFSVPVQDATPGPTPSAEVAEPRRHRPRRPDHQVHQEVHEQVHQVHHIHKKRKDHHTRPSHHTHHTHHTHPTHRPTPRTEGPELTIRDLCDLGSRYGQWAPGSGTDRSCHQMYG
jgi:hypothetical protein